jgi:YVTN family beta-propeller protein
VIATIPVGCGPFGAAYDSLKNEIFVANSCANTVSVISVSAGAAIATITLPAGSTPEGVAFDTSNGYVYTANPGAGTVSIISDKTNKVLTTIAAGYFPWGITYDSRNGYVYTANDGSGDSVQVISGLSIIDTIQVGSSPDGITYDGESDYIYAANSGTHTLSVISGATNTVVGTIAYGDWFPYWVAYGSKSGDVYVADYGSADVYVVSGYTNKVVSKINMPSSTVEMSYDSGNDDAYATAGCYIASNQVWVIDGSTNTYLTAITVGTNPCGVAYDPVNGYLYVANSGSNTVSVISTSNPQATTPSPSVSSVDLSQGVTFTTSAVGGIAPYTYVWNNLPTGCTSASVTILTCVPTGPGIFHVSVTITDATGYSTMSGAVTFPVYIDPTVSVPNPSMPSADMGQTLTFIANVTGGSGTYIGYTWAVSSPSLGCVVASSPKIVCTPTTNGTYDVSLYVTDSNGCSSGTPGGCAAVATVSAPFIVYTDPSVGRPTAYPHIIDAGQTVNFTSATPTGGLPPYIYTWLGLPANCTSSGIIYDVCTPHTGGAFNISVAVTDTNGYSITSLPLTYTVNSTLTVTLSASASKADLGQSIHYAGTASYGAPPYIYTWTFPSEMGCGNSTGSMLNCTPTETGTFHVTIWVFDRAGKNVATSASLIVNSTPVVSLSGSQATDVNRPLFFSATPGGGTPPYSYQWRSYAGLGCRASKNHTLSCTPNTAGTYPVVVTLTDSVGGTNISALSVTVNPLPTVTISGANATDVNATVQFSALPVGGTAPYAYFWSYSNGMDCLPSTNTSLACRPLRPGDFTVGVHMNDSVGLSSTTRFSVAVNKDPSVILSGANATVENKTIILTAMGSGGTPPYSYIWDFPAALGCASTTNDSLTCTPFIPGNYTINVTLIDSAGMNATVSGPIKVMTTPAPPPIPSQPVTIPWWIPMLIAAILVVVFLVLFVRREQAAQTRAEEGPPEIAQEPQRPETETTPPWEVSQPEVISTEEGAPPEGEATTEAPREESLPSEGEPTVAQRQEIPTPELQFGVHQYGYSAPQDYPPYPEAQPPEPAPTAEESPSPTCPECGANTFLRANCPVCGSPTRSSYGEKEQSPGQMALIEYLDNYRAEEKAPEEVSSPPAPEKKPRTTCPKCGLPLPGPDQDCPICAINPPPE